MFDFTNKVTSSSGKSRIRKLTPPFLPQSTPLFLWCVKGAVWINTITWTRKRWLAILWFFTFMLFVVQWTFVILAFHAQVAVMMMMFGIIFTLPLDFMISVLVLLTWLA
jgi:hypothetical protein